MPYQAVMALPMRVFWEFSGNVDRIRCDEALMTLEIGTSLQSPDGATSMREHISKQAPSPFKLTSQGKVELTAAADPGAADMLRSLANV